MDFGTFLNFFIALVVVLGLIGVLSWAGQRFGLPTFGRRRGAPKRIGVVEAVAVDSKHRLVLVRRDQVEHLVMLDPTGAVVVETNIVKGGAGEKPAAVERPRKAADKQQVEAASWLER